MGIFTSKLNRIIIILLTLVILSAILVGSYLSKTFSKVVVKENNQILSISKSPVPSPIIRNSSFNILLLGYGGSGHDGGELTDSIIATNINKETKKITLISVPRDLWVNNAKINAAYLKGASLAKEALVKVLGIQMDYYVAVDFGGFSKTIDILGGIRVNVKETFDDYLYPVKGLENETCGKSPEELKAINATMSGFLLEKEFTCRYEHLHFDKGQQTMDGAMALKFVRSRHSAVYGTDFARSERQHFVLLGIKDKLLSLGIMTKIDPLLQNLAASVKTDINLSTVREFVAKNQDITNYQINNLYINEGNFLRQSTGPAGAFILIPKAGDGNYQEIQQYIKDNLK